VSPGSPVKSWANVCVPGSPSVEVVSWEEKDSIKVTVFMLKAGEDKIVAQRLKEELEKASKA
jgi:L-seryl-tRNA(Ser) seleniumtransferase